MRVGAFLAILLITLPGCALIQAILIPPKRPAPTMSAATPPAPPSPPAAVPGPPPAPPSPPAAVPGPPPAPPSAEPAAPIPAPPTSVPSAALTPEMSPDQERRLREEAQRKVDETDRMLRQLEGRSLKPKERETFSLAQSFVDQARKALAAKEYERAANLATKARTLTDDLAATAK